MQQKFILENLLIDSFANEGKCVARHDGKIVFVRETLPGEIVKARAIKNKKDWIEAEVIEILKPSPERQSPFCQHFGYCGGCQWQHMEYQAQLRYKEWLVVETLQ